MSNHQPFWLLVALESVLGPQAQVPSGLELVEYIRTAELMRRNKNDLECEKNMLLSRE